jgi:hypothetical protein
LGQYKSIKARKMSTMYINDQEDMEADRNRNRGKKTKKRSRFLQGTFSKLLHCGLISHRECGRPLFILVWVAMLDR